MTVGEIERTMSSAECAEWTAYFDLRANDTRQTAIRDTLKRDARAGLETLGKRKR